MRRVQPKVTEDQLELFRELRELVGSRSGDVKRADELIQQLTGTPTEESDDAGD